GGPQVGPETVSRRLLGQPPKDSKFVVGGQERLPPRAWLGPQSVVTAGPVCSDPHSYRPLGHPYEGGYMLLRPALGDPLDGQPAACLQVFRGSPGLHPTGACSPSAVGRPGRPESGDPVL